MENLTEDRIAPLVQCLRIANMVVSDNSTSVKMPVSSLLAFLAGPGLVAVAAGVYPTWRLEGPPGLAAMASAGVAVFVAMFASGCAILWRSGGQVDRVALRFAGAAIFRVSICLALAAGAWYIFALPTNILFLWTGAFYLVMLIGESFWLARTLKRRAKECSSPK